MKAVILAGGLGSRIAEETHLKPKPMIEIGGRPILWHIMKLYYAHGVRDFIICCGFKGYVIKEYFANYGLHMSDITFDLSQNSIEFHRQSAENWRVTLVDTGENSMTGGRLKRVASYLRDDDAFCFTYGDGVGNVDIGKTIAFHKSHGKQAHGDRRSPPGALWRPAAGRHRSPGLYRKAGRRGRLHQRRLLRAVPPRHRPDRGGSFKLGRGIL